MSDLDSDFLADSAGDDDRSLWPVYMRPRRGLSWSCGSGDHDRDVPCEGPCGCGCHRDDDGLIGKLA